MNFFYKTIGKVFENKAIRVRRGLLASLLLYWLLSTGVINFHTLDSIPVALILIVLGVFVFHQAPFFLKLILNIEVKNIDKFDAPIFVSLEDLKKKMNVLGMRRIFIGSAKKMKNSNTWGGYYSDFWRALMNQKYFSANYQFNSLAYFLPLSQTRNVIAVEFTTGKVQFSYFNTYSDLKTFTDLVNKPGVEVEGDPKKIENAPDKSTPLQLVVLFFVVLILLAPLIYLLDATSR